jgi:hypothetical protein
MFSGFMQSDCITIVSRLRVTFSRKNISHEVKILIPLWQPDSKQD